MSLSVEISIVVLLIVINGFFAMSELAIVSARRVRLRQMADDGHRGAQLALDMAEDPASFLSIVQVVLTVNSVLAGAFSGATLAEHYTDYFNSFAWITPHGEAAAIGVTVAIVTYGNLMIGELIPKRIGLSYAEPIAIRVSYMMKFFSTLVAPLIWILRHSTECALRIIGLSEPRDTTVTQDEVKGMIAEGTESGVFKPAEKDMLEGVMRLADRTVRSIMTPRMDMMWLSAEDSSHDNHAVIKSSGYSRFPLMKGDLEEVLGIVYAKDVLNAVLDDGNLPPLKSVMRPALTVPDTTSVLRLLEEFKKSKQHLAIVADEYGSVEGLVSASDILTAITGTLPERGDESSTAPHRRQDGSWLIDGWTPIDEVETLLELKDMRGKGDFHTLAGFVVDRLGHIPSAGDHFQWEETRFEVVDMDGRRVDKVLVTPPPDPAEEAEGD